MTDLPALARRLHEGLIPRHAAVDHAGGVDLDGGPSCPVCALILSALEEATRAETERADKAQADYQFMVNRAMDEKLDGYRALGARAAAAEERAEKAEAEAAALRESEQSAIRGRDMAVDIANARSREAAALRAKVEVLPLREHQLLVAKEQRDAAEREVEALRVEVEALKAKLEQAEKERDEAKSIGNALLNSAYVCADPAHEGLDAAHRAGRREALREVLPYADCSRCAPEEDCRLAALRAEAEGAEG